MGGANGLIVAFVVAVWAAYFVPLALRRYDEAGVDSSSASTSLEDLGPRSRVIRDGESAGRPAQPAAAAQERPARPAITRRAAIVAARRRRRTLITLLTALLLVGGLAVVSVIPPVWVLAPAALVVAWLVACRVQVRAERGIGRMRPETGPRSVDEEPTVVVSGQIEDVDPGRRHVMQIDDLAEDALDDRIQIAVPSVSTDGQALWDPLPVTLPTYVTKPRVGRTVRTIDFTAPGAWTSGHIEGEDVELPGRAEASSPNAPSRDEQPRRASGE